MCVGGGGGGGEFVVGSYMSMQHRLYKFSSFLGGGVEAGGGGNSRATPFCMKP